MTRPLPSVPFRVWERAATGQLCRSATSEGHVPVYALATSTARDRFFETIYEWRMERLRTLAERPFRVIIITARVEPKPFLPSGGLKLMSRAISITFFVAWIGLSCVAPEVVWQGMVH